MDAESRGRPREEFLIPLERTCWEVVEQEKERHETEEEEEEGGDQLWRPLRKTTQRIRRFSRHLLTDVRHVGIFVIFYPFTLIQVISRPFTRPQTYFGV